MSEEPQFDAIVAGAGMAGLYMLHRLRQQGMSAVVLETGDDVGGTWYWNRYPGARCDIPTTDYTYSWDPELEQAWTWSEKYATQPEILRFLQFVAERYDLRRDIRFSTRVESATWDDAASLWRLRTSTGDDLTARWYIMATGCLSMPKTPDIEGAGRFTGEVYNTSSWPHDGVDFTGKRVGVIGTGSSGIQSIPLIAKQATQLTVFQRTANFSVPAWNGPAPADRLARLAEDRAAYRLEGKYTPVGAVVPVPEFPAGALTTEQQKELLDAAWDAGELLRIGLVFNDQGSKLASNDVVCEYVRGRIREIVKDPQTAEDLCPNDHPIGSKRTCLDTGYYATYNEPHVRLVNLRRTPIETVTEHGVKTTAEEFEFDALVLATGFDAMTGALVGVDITGKDGVTLKEKWGHGPLTYLGLFSVGFPNLFMITGPGSPSVLSNMSVSIEQHVDFIADTLSDLRDGGFDTIEATQHAEDGWGRHVNDGADISLFPLANSWYMGSNVPGKPRVFLPYVAGVGEYRRACEEVVAKGYLGLRLAGPGGEQCNDGLVRELQVDVKAVLDAMAELGLPPLESLSPADARDFVVQGAAVSPPGPEIGEIVDGVLPGPGGDLEYRVYRPEGEGPHPIVLYFHGGGWVLGSAISDDPFCRDLCKRSECVLVSVNYRHAPEARFPAAVDDAWAALTWVDEHAIELGGISGQLAVAGWSAGGNLAAVVAQLARDNGGPAIAGQLLITPVTDHDLETASYVENADGYVLTKPLMVWFWDHYIDESDRADPRVSPLKADSLAGLPPAFVVTAQFDPLRDEGQAYAAAMEAAGVPVEQLKARGHTHTSLTMVDVILSGAPAREEMANALKGFFKA